MKIAARFLVLWIIGVVVLSKFLSPVLYTMVTPNATAVFNFMAIVIWMVVSAIVSCQRR